MSLLASDVKVGLRVIGVGIMDDVDITDMHGEIVSVQLDGCYAVKFDETNESFHDCSGVIEHGYGYWCYLDNLRAEETFVEYTPTQEGDREDDI